MKKIIVVASATLLCCGCVALEKAVERNGITEYQRLVVGVSFFQEPHRVGGSVGLEKTNATSVADSDKAPGAYIEHKTMIGAQPGDIVDETKVTLGK